MDDRPIDKTIQQVLGPAEPEILCDECFDTLDEYVELELRGLPADDRLPGMRPHLEGCPACREEHESLCELVRAADASA